MLFLLPLLVNIRSFNIPDLDFVMSILFFIVSLFFYQSDILNTRLNKGCGLLFLIVFLTAISLMRSADYYLLTKIRLSTIVLLYSLSTMILVNYFSARIQVLHIMLNGLVFYLYVVLVATRLNPQSNFAKFLSNLSYGDLMAQGGSVFAVEYSYAPMSNNHLATFVAVGLIYMFYRLRSRMSLIWMFHVIIFIVFIISTAARLPIIIIALILPFILFGSVDLIVRKWLILILPFTLIFISLFNVLSRLGFLSVIINNQEELLTINGRLYIWIETMNELFHFKPIHLIGYGHHGNLQMDGVKSFLLATTTSEALAFGTLHNMYLQMIADMGYLFLVMFMFLLYRVLTNITTRIRDKQSAVLLIGIIMNFQLCGMNESLWGNYLIANVIIMVAIFSYVIFSPKYDFV
ncbi:hypothetical protein Clim_1900 [Chlorobium limicola DSM 245]|uniref:O-antigen ligase-related domain-containing protein n=2 Tax=Chlorobium limicola TaxID=1092 RepID=B3EF71_CHLL2|nr:hypothetical protein Clim_1900 [Chlorobium limicola DSM 245]